VIDRASRTAAVTTRPATADDVDFLCDAFLGSLRDAITATRGRWDAQREREQFLSQLHLPGTRLIDCEGRAVGFLTVLPVEGTLDLHTLCIVPEHQGQGIGAHVMRALVAEAGRRAIRLSVLKTNPRARAFYERLGFTVARIAPHHLDMRRTPDSARSRLARALAEVIRRRWRRRP
jgi:ribosomal protein S18 acetylase RimI-like enzyme